MTWLRIDDAFADHPKIVGLSATAFRLHVTGLCYAAKHETDGMIPFAAAFVVASRKAVGELVEAGLWARGETGFLVHDYLDYNPSRRQILSTRDAKRMAGAKGAASRWHGYGNAPGPDPSRPVDQQPPAAAEPESHHGAREGLVPPLVPPDFDDETRCIRAFDGLMGSLAGTPPVQKAIREWLETAPRVAPGPAALFEDACTEAALNDGKSLKYVLAILKRWQREGREDRRHTGTATAGAPSANGAVNTGAGLIVKTFEQEFAGQRREEAARGA